MGGGSDMHRDPGCRDCRAAMSGNCGKHAPTYHLAPPELRASVRNLVPPRVERLMLQTCPCNPIQPHLCWRGIELSLRELRYIVEEVQRQGDGPVHVACMAEAWALAKRNKRDGLPVTPALIAGWGKLVEPEVNAGGFRRVDVWVGGSKCPHWVEAVDKVAYLCKAISEVRLDPDDVYREFLLAHPFRDGNGRTGKVLMNYLADTLERPTMPSNWFNCSNP